MTPATAAFLLIATSDASSPESPLSTATVEEVVAVHFTAIQDGDRAALLSVWDEASAHVSSLEGGRIAQVPALEAIALWSASPAPDTRWVIQSVSILNSEISTVQASLTWKGSTYAEFLTLIHQPTGWQLVSKVYTVTAPLGGGGDVSPYQ